MPASIRKNKHYHEFETINISAFGSSGTNSYLVPFLCPATFAYIFLGYNQGISTYDEGLTVYGASQILDGAVLYRDIWSSYAPGQYYLIALAFRIFGELIIVERMLSVFINSMIVFSVFLLARRLVPCRYALFSWFLTLALFTKYLMYGSPTTTALMLCLLSCLSLIKAFETNYRKWWLLTGIFLGLTAIFRHDFGAYAFIAESMTVVLFSRIRVDAKDNASGDKLVRRLHNYLYLVAGTTGMFVPVVALLLLNVDIKILFEDLILFPATVYSKVRAMPWPAPCPNPLEVVRGQITIARFFRRTLQMFPPYMPAVFFLTAFHLLSRKRKKHAFNSPEILQSMLLLLGIVFFNYSCVGKGMVPQIILASVLLPAALYSFRNMHPSKCRTVFYSFTIFMALMASLSFGRLFLHSTGRKLNISRSSSQLVPLDIERAWGMKLPQKQAESLLKAMRCVQTITDPEEKIFVGTSRHDRLWANDVMFYFLVDRHNATVYDDLCPGLVTTELVQREIVEDLLANRVRCIVLTNAFENFERTNKSNESSGVVLLDNFIREHYDETASFDCYSIGRINSKGEKKLLGKPAK